MKAAFSVWSDRIAPVFDVASLVHVVEAEGGKVLRETQETLPGELPVQKALRLVELGVGTLICGAISRPLHELVVAYGIRVIPFVAGDLRHVVRVWSADREDWSGFAMPGCRGRGRRRRGDRLEEYREEEAAMQASGRGGMGGGGGGGRGQGRGGWGLGRMGGPSAGGPAGRCVCPQCGHAEAHQRGEPCSGRQCPKCGTAMTRE